MFITIAEIRKLFSLSFFCVIARGRSSRVRELWEPVASSCLICFASLISDISRKIFLFFWSTLSAWRESKEIETERKNGGLIFWGLLCTVFLRDEEGNAPSVAVYNHSLAARETDPSPGGESVQAGPSFLRTRPGEAVWDCGTACQVQAPLWFHPQSVVFFLQSPHLRFIIAPEVHTSWRLSRPSSEAILL